MPEMPRYSLVFVTLTFLLPRLCMPVPAMADGKITKIAPHFLSTPQEYVTPDEVSGTQTKSGSWIYAVLGVAVLAALVGASGGGGGGDGANVGGSGDSEQSGGVSVGW